jgi:hypothetical protein
MIQTPNFKPQTSNFKNQLRHKFLKSIIGIIDYNFPD